MLPAIEIRKPNSILAKETITAMQAGLVYGQIGQTEYIIKRMKEESGYPDAKVIATGGLGKMIANETDMIDVYDSQLTLKGLRFIYEKNKKITIYGVDNVDFQRNVQHYISRWFRQCKSGAILADI